MEFMLPEFQCWGISSKGSRVIPGGTELSGIWTRTEGADFFQTEVLEEAMALLRSPHPHRANRWAPPVEKGGRRLTHKKAIKNNTGEGWWWIRPGR